LDEIVCRSRARLERAKERAHRVGVLDHRPGTAAAALKAALDAYDEAFAAPSTRGLPSAAAIEAYLAILPAPESEVRTKLEAALAIRREDPAGHRMH
jgi:hypothetical protein